MTLSARTSEEKSHSLVRDSVRTTVTNGALAVVGVLVWIAIARFLDPKWRGALALVMIAPALVMRIGTFGFDQGAVVIGGANRDRLAVLTRTGLLFGFLAGLCFMALFMGFMWGFPKTFWRTMQEIWLPWPFMVITLAFPVHLMTMALDSAIYAEDRIDARNRKELVVNLVMLVGIVLSVLGFRLVLFGVVLPYLAANIISLVYALLLVKDRIPLRGAVNFGLLMESIRLGFPMYLAQLASFLMLPAMMVVLSWQMPGEAHRNLARIAFFTMAYQMVDRILPVTRSIGFALLPKITSGTEETARSLAAKAGRQTFAVSLVLFALLIGFMHPIVRILLGKRYLPVVVPFWIMAPGGVALSVGGVWASHLLARQKPLQVAWSGLAGIVAALAVAAAGFHWLQEREVMAASIAVVAGSLVNSAMLLTAFCRTAGLSVRDALLPAGEDFREWRRIPAFAREILARRRPGDEVKELI